MLGNRFTSEPNFFVCAVSDQKTRLIFQRNIIDFLHFIFTASPISVYSCFKSCFVRICGILMFSFISLYWCSLFYMPVFRPFTPQYGEVVRQPSRFAMLEGHLVVECVSARHQSRKRRAQTTLIIRDLKRMAASHSKVN